MASLGMLSNKYDAQVTWNFSATNHNKGPVDEVSSTLKTHVIKKVITRKCVMNNTEEFCDAIRKVFCSAP